MVNFRYILSFLCVIERSQESQEP